MRVLIAPDKFAGTLTAVEAAEAIAAGWRRHAPDDELDLAPMADGGPGFVDVLHAALGGDARRPSRCAARTASRCRRRCCASARRRTSRARRPPVCTWSTGRPGDRDEPRRRRAAARRRRGRGDAPSSSGSAARAPTTAAPACSPPSARPSDGVARRRRRPRSPSVTSVDLGAGPRPAGRRRPLVAASDVDNPLTGLFGATKTFGPQKGIGEDRIAEVDGWLEGFAVATDRRTSLEKGAGAAGGIGYALLAPRRHPRAGHRPGRRRGRPRRAGPRRRPGGHGGGRLRLLQPRRQGALRRRRGRRRGAPAVHRARRAGARSARARCAPSASSRRTPSSSWWGRSAPSAPPPTRSPTSPSGSRAPGRADGVPVRLARLGE